MFTKQYYAMMNNALFGLQIPCRYKDGKWNTNTPPFVGPGWTDRYADSYVAIGFYNIGTLLKNEPGTGVILGTSNEPASEDDYTYKGKIVTGYEHFVKTYVYPESKKNGDFERKAVYTITNPTKEAIIINEICYFAGGWLLDRTVLEKPLEIAPNGGVGKLTYSIINHPVTCLPDDGVNVDDNDVYSLSRCIYNGEYRRLGACRDFYGIKLGESSQFDSIAPWKDMKKYNIVNNMIGPSEDMETFDPKAETVVYIPEFYFYCNYGNINTASVRWSISAEPKKGYIKHPGSGRYVGRYLASKTPEGQWQSMPGFKPEKDKPLTEYRTIHNRGEHFWMMDIATASAIWMLMMIECGSARPTDILGIGYAPWWYGGGPPLENTGSTDTATYKTQRIGNHCEYRWLEDIFFYFGLVADGIKIDKSQLYYEINNKLFSDPNLPEAKYSYGPIPIDPVKSGKKFILSTPNPNCLLPLPISAANTYTIYTSGNTISKDTLQDGEGIRLFGAADNYESDLYKNRIVVPYDADGLRNLETWDYQCRTRSDRATTIIYIP